MKDGPECSLYARRAPGRQNVEFHTDTLENNPLPDAAEAADSLETTHEGHDHGHEGHDHEHTTSMARF